MIRRATDDDIPAMKVLRAAVRENRLSDPNRVKDEDIRWFIANPGMFLWVDDTGRLLGFSAADPRDGSIWALFIDPESEGRGIASALLSRACNVLEDAGHARAWLTTDPGTRAEGFYRRKGWVVTGMKGSELLFERDLAPS